MSKTFLSLFEELKDCSKSKKRSLTLKISNLLESDEDSSEELIRNYLNSILIRSNSSVFRNIVKSDYFATRIKSYIDDDYKTKISVGVAYLQDSDNHIANLDEVLSESLVSAIEQDCLDLLVNDISVNSIQYRNSSKV